MLFSGAAISLAAWGHWVPERSRPALLPVRRRLTVYLPACLSAWLHVSLCLSDYLSAIAVSPMV